MIRPRSKTRWRPRDINLAPKHAFTLGLFANPDDAVKKLITISDISLELVGSKQRSQGSELVKTKLNVTHSLSRDPKRLYSSEPEVKKSSCIHCNPT